MELFEKIAVLHLEMIFFVWECSSAVCVPCGFCGRSGSEVNLSHVFPEGVLIAKHLDEKWS